MERKEQALNKLHLHGIRSFFCSNVLSWEHKWVGLCCTWIEQKFAIEMHSVYVDKVSANSVSPNHVNFLLTTIITITTMSFEERFSLIWFPFKDRSHGKDTLQPISSSSSAVISPNAVLSFVPTMALWEM